jgi:hypothetical protein
MENFTLNPDKHIRGLKCDILRQTIAVHADGEEHHIATGIVTELCTDVRHPECNYCDECGKPFFLDQEVFLDDTEGMRVCMQHVTIVTSKGKRVI